MEGERSWYQEDPRSRNNFTLVYMLKFRSVRWPSIEGSRSGQYHRRPKLITWTRTWLLLASGVVLQTVIYKGLYGIDRFFLKEIKNVMFLNKIDVPYCLVVFFAVCPRLRPFWSVFGELALFWCPTAKRKTRQNSDSRSVRRSRRIIPLENYPRL